MSDKMKYRRFFLIFKAEDTGYASGGQPSGYVRIETRDGKGRFFLSVQNLREDPGRLIYKAYLISSDGKKVSPAYFGVLQLRKGRAELEQDFDPADVGQTGLSIDEFNIAAVIAEHENRAGSGLICPLAAYKSGKCEWRRDAWDAMRKRSGQAEEKGEPAKTAKPEMAVRPERLMESEKPAKRHESGIWEKLGFRKKSEPEEKPGKKVVQEQLEAQDESRYIEGVPAVDILRVNAEVKKRIEERPPAEAAENKPVESKQEEKKPGDAAGFGPVGKKATGNGAVESEGGKTGQIIESRPKEGTRNREAEPEAQSRLEDAKMPGSPGIIKDKRTELVKDSEPQPVEEKKPEFVKDTGPQFVKDKEPENVEDKKPELVVDSEPVAIGNEMPKTDSNRNGGPGVAATAGIQAETGLREKAQDLSEDQGRGGSEKSNDDGGMAGGDSSKSETLEKFMNHSAEELLKDVGQGAANPAAGTDRGSLEGQHGTVGKESGMDTGRMPGAAERIAGTTDQLTGTAGQMPGAAERQAAQEAFERKQYILNNLRIYLDRFFPVTDPFGSKRRDFIWWKINNPVSLNNILFQCGIKTPMLFNPTVMMAHFKYRHLIFGIYTNKVQQKEYLVCGVPGVYNMDERPFGQMCRWVQLEGVQPRTGAFGYWLVYMDPESGKLLSFN